MGLKIEAAYEELGGRLVNPDAPKAPPKAAEEAAGMAMLQSLMGQTDFGGPRG